MTTLFQLFQVLKGGPRSGNWGHAGRLGRHGGSAPKSGVGAAMSLLSGRDWEVRRDAKILIPQNKKTQKHVQEYLRDEYHLEEIKEAVERLTKLVEGCPVAMRVPEDVLIKILDDGEFKNQHETKTSGGHLNPEFRKQAEKKAFGEDLENFPLYGYISTNKSASKDAFTPDTYYYGGVKIVFKDEVRVRTTITAGDSLGMFNMQSGTGSPLVKPTEVSLNGEVYNLTGLGRPHKLDYIEAQIHGKLTVKDIQKVIISRKSPALEDSLREQGIPFTVANHPTETEDTF